MLHTFFKTITPWFKLPITRSEQVQKLSRIDDNNSLSVPNRIQVAIWIILLFVAAILSLQAQPDVWWSGTAPWRWDEKTYAILARSLIYADTFSIMHAPGEAGTTPFQFGYPLLLAPSVLLFPQYPDAMRALSFMAMFLNATLLFWEWRWLSRRSYWWGIAIAGLYLLSPETLKHSQMLLAEPVFLTFCLATIILVEQARWGKQNRWWSIWISITLTFAIFTRIIGVILIPSMFAYMLYVKGIGFWKELVRIIVQIIILVSLIIAIVPAQITADGILPTRYYQEAAGGATFINTLAVTAGLADQSDGNTLLKQIDETERLIDEKQLNLKVFFRNSVIIGIDYHVKTALLKAFFPFEGRSLGQRLGMGSTPILLSYLVFGLLIIGFLRWFSIEGLSAFSLFAILYSGALLLWVWHHSRFLYPIQPQLHFGFLLGIEAILLGLAKIENRTDFLRKHRNNIMIFVILFLALTSIFKSWVTLADIRVVDNLYARSSWLKSNTPVSAIALTENPQVDFLYSNRKTVPYPKQPPNSGSELYDYLLEYNVDYILIAPELMWRRRSDPTPTYRYTDPTIRILPFIEELVAENQVARVCCSEPELIKIFKVQR